MLELEYIFVKDYKILNDTEVIFIPEKGYPEYYYDYFSENKFTILVGENGVGKTTLMSFIATVFKNLQRFHNKITSEFKIKYSLGKGEDSKKVILEKQETNIFITVVDILPRSLLLEYNMSKKRYILKSHQEFFERRVTYDEIRKYLPFNIITSVFSMHGEYPSYHPNLKGDRIIEEYDVSNIYGDNHYRFTSLSRGMIRFIQICIDEQSKAKDLLSLLGLEFTNEILVRSLLYTRKYSELKIGMDMAEDPRYPDFAFELLDEHKQLIEKFNDLEYFIRSNAISIENYENDENVWISIDEDNLDELLRFENEGLIYINDISFSKVGEFISLSNMSSGEKMLFIRFLSLLSSVEDDSLIIIEEPELHLNPSWTKQIITLFQMLFSDYNVHFLISTHSHLFINTVFPENIIYVEEGEFVQPDTSESTFLANEVEISNRFFENYSKLNYIEDLLWKKVETAEVSELKNIIGYLGESYTRFKLVRILMKKEG